MTNLVTILGWIVICVLISDVIVGLFHWAEDSYCSDTTAMGNFLQKLVGNHICEPNLDHHINPRLMVSTGFFTRNITPWLAALIASTLIYLINYNFWQLHLIFWVSSFGNEVHKWNHMLESELNCIQRFMKDSGIVQAKKNHMIHHKPPHMTNYCVMIDFNNAWMERIGFWRKLEYLLYLAGVQTQRENRRDSNG